jgi:hypothetical protein
MKLLRNVLTGLGVLSAVILSAQVVKADNWGYGQNYPPVQNCQWVLSGYTQNGSTVYRQVCSSSLPVYSDYSTPYNVDTWYPNSNYNNGYNQSGFSIQFGIGNGGYNNLPFGFNNGGYHRHHRHH